MSVSEATRLKGNCKKRSYSRLLLVVVVALAAALWLLDPGRGPAGTGTAKASGIRQVILISIDTCRADYLSCYGYGQRTTPNIDALAAESFLFENVLSPIPQTLPAHVSLMTGTVPPTHGVHFNKGYRFDKTNVALAEILKDAGYTTGAIVSAFVLDSQFGMAQGFDTYHDSFATPLDGETVVQRQGGETTGLALDWLDRHIEGKSFLFLHYYDPHMLYRPPEPFASRFAEDPYAGEIAYADHCIGQVLDRLKAKGMYDTSLIIVTSDHGEMLGEHGEESHGYFIYQPAIKVPLIVKLPGRTEARRISALAGIIDIVPTVCGLLGVAPPGQVEGIDLSAAFDGQEIPGDRALFCESLWPTQYSANSLLGLVDAQYKYIQTTRPELYELTTDPGETINLAAAEPARAQRMKDELALILQESAANNSPGGKTLLDEETRRRLESLGYVGGPVVEEFDFDQTKPDPKEFIAYHALGEKVAVAFEAKAYDKVEQYARQQLQLHPELPHPYGAMAKVADARNELDRAIELYSKVLELEPAHVISYAARGSVYARQNRHDLAIRDFDKAIELVPIDPAYYTKRGFSFMSTDDLTSAIGDFSRAIQLNPEYGMAHYNRGLAYNELGQFDRAIRDFDRAIESDARHPGVWNSRGLSWFHKGNREPAPAYYTQALKNFTHAIELDSNYSQAWYNRGSLLARIGEAESAIRDFRESVALTPRNPAPHADLARMLVQQGRGAEGVESYKRALSLRPEWPQVMNELAWRLATHADKALRDGAEAVRLAERASELIEQKHPVVLDTLAAAYAEAGEFAKAVETAELVLQMAVAAGQAEVAADVRQRLDLYKAGKPYRVP